ncbi:protein ROOT PRIMORDIUM DEFECTIVE 1 isoform X2 [Asparagus officinalis]|uniref:protein ROOT PRIMORDIUM DEFECTIVE 1 isoform X2 n=1 Tax=Asparagus officinalis TaxID=4686 RepID=UPI00098E7B5C|nr:protein ROOT PRIMORDIUM DEFECTIVE 1 isoform X2 [Asparagus officinalis]
MADSGGGGGESSRFRWKKPVDSAQTRLENRTRDLKLDKLMHQMKRLRIILKLHELMSKAKDGYTSVQIVSRWRNIVGIHTGVGDFLRKYPHVFEIYRHPSRKNVCCRVLKDFNELVMEEARIVEESSDEIAEKVKKLLMMSNQGSLHLHSLWLVRRELGLPDDFRTSIIDRYPDEFSVVYPDTVVLVRRDESLAEAKVEKWREREYIDKWLSEYETKYAFPINFPTGFRIETGFREKLKNWQRLPYVKPYEKREVIRVKTCGGTERFEKRAVGILHEFLSLTVEKFVEVERLSHFRRDFNMEVNMRELLLKHPGIFSISTKGSTQTVILREAYSKGCLIEPNPIYEVRRKMLYLVSLGSLYSRQMGQLNELEERYKKESSCELVDGPCDGDWDILQNSDEQLDDINEISRDP